MDWFILWFGIQAGWFSQELLFVTPDYSITAYETPFDTTEIMMDARLLAFEHIEIAGFIKSYQIFREFPNIVPFRVDYGISTCIIWGPFRAGVRHECDHQVNYLNDRTPVKWLFSSKETEIFIRFESKVEF